jgi:hypothetical protein
VHQELIDSWNIVKKDRNADVNHMSMDSNPYVESLFPVAEGNQR